MFETTKKKKAAQQAADEWTANRPADYASTNKDTINSIIDSIGTGFNWNATDKNYLNYKSEATDSANKAAQAAVAAANTLSGGYDSSYAQSSAQQSKNAELASIANAMTDLKGQALTEYQNNQSSILNSLGNAADTEALDQSAYGLDRSNYNGWQGFLENALSLAKSEDSSYWNNVWDTISGIGSAVLGAYDTYKGYTQQKKSAQTSAMQQAIAFEDAGAHDMATAVLDNYGIDSSILDSYVSTKAAQAAATGYTAEDQMTAITKAASLASNGYTDAARYVLNQYGIDDNVLTNYALTAAASGRSSGSSSSGSGRSSGKSSTSKSSGFTNSQLQTMANKFSSMKDTDPLYSFYKQTLTDAGWLQSDTAGSGSLSGLGGTSGTSSASSIVAPYSAVKLRSQGASNTAIERALQNEGYSQSQAKRITGQSGTGLGSSKTKQMAAQVAYNMATAGRSTDDITDTLINYGLSNKEIYNIMKNL